MSEKTLCRSVDFAGWLLGLCLAIFSSTVFAQNYHEHLFALPNAKYFEASILDEKFEGPTLNKIFADRNQLKWFLLQVGSKELHFPLSWSLGRFLRYLLQVESLPIDGILSFAYPLAVPAQNRTLYDRFSELRKHLFLSLPIGEIQKIYSDYAAQEFQKNLRPVLATASPSVFNVEQIDKLRTIHCSLKDQGGHIEFYYSLQRNKWLDDNWEWKQSAELLRQEGLLTGLDLTGSLYEANKAPQQQPPQSTDFFKQKFITLFTFVTEKKLRLRLHIFEHLNSGPFYEGLKLALIEFAQPLKIEIGHMNSLNKTWILFFKSLQKHNFEFQATPSSYEVLADNYSENNLIENIKFLAAEGFHAKFGFDGRGILENTWKKRGPGLCAPLFIP